MATEHQKDYFLPLPDIAPNKVRLNQKKIWDSFFAKSQSSGKKKGTNSEVYLGKNELAVEKARVDFLDKIHDLHTHVVIG